MGYFCYVAGIFQCVRCAQDSDTAFQTKLLAADVNNSYHTYRAGEVAVIDGLDDYCPLHAHDGVEDLVIAIGDWDCEHCGLNWQWAKAVFKIEHVGGQLHGMLQELTTLQPNAVDSLAGVHYLEPDLAELSGLWPDYPDYDWGQGLAAWTACSIETRCTLVAAGYRDWHSEMAVVKPASR